MTSSKSKVKGTAFEREVKSALGWPELRRTAASCAWDLEIMGGSPVEVLVTRPDRGRALVTLPLEDFAAMYEHWRQAGTGLRVECKRFKQFAHHGIYESTFGGNEKTHGSKPQRVLTRMAKAQS